MVIAWLVFWENANRKLILGAGSILAGAILLSWTFEGCTTITTNTPTTAR